MQSCNLSEQAEEVGNNSPWTEKGNSLACQCVERELHSSQVQDMYVSCATVAISLHHMLLMLDDALTLTLLLQKPVTWVNNVAHFEHSQFPFWTLVENNVDSLP